MSKGGLKGLAANTLAMQKQTKSVPNHVRESARKILQGTGTAQDAANIRQYSGVKQSGASATNRQARAINSAMGQAGKYASLGSAISQGGAVGFGGGLGLINQVGRDVQSIAKDSGVRNAFISAGQYLGSKLGTDQGGAMANRALMGARRTAAQASALAGTLATAIELANGAQTVGQFIGDSLLNSRDGVERRRLADQEFSIVNADSLLSVQEKKLAALRNEEVHRLANGWASAPLIGNILSRFDHRTQDADQREARIVAQGGPGSSLRWDQQWNQAHHRYNLQEYGTEESAKKHDQLDALVGTSNEASKGILAEFKRALSASADYADKFHQAAENKRFDLAEAYKKAANEENAGTIPSQIDANTWYQGAESVRISERMWAYSQMPRAGPREH